MSLTATQLVAEVTASGADETMSALLAVGDAATTAGEQLTGLEGVDIGPIAGNVDLISASFEALTPQVEDAATAIDTVASSSDSLTVLNDILVALQEQTAAITEGFGALDTSVQELAANVDTVAASIDILDESLAGMKESEASAAEGADGLSLSMDGLKEAMGPLMMIGALAAMAGAKFIGMGMDGQKGEALLKGMAGASSADIQMLESDANDLGMTMDKASAGFYEVESAGYSGSQAISVFDAATRLAIGGQASEQDTLTALTAIMHDYHDSASQAMTVTDQMAETIVIGKQSMEDYASSIGPLAAQASNLGISFQEVNAAEAAMTQVNPHVRQDTLQLTALMKTLSPTMGTVATNAKKLGLEFNEAHFKSLDLLGQLQYLAQIAGGSNTAAFIKLTGGVQGSTAAIDLLSGKGKAFIANMKALGDSTGATEHAFQSYDATIPGALDHVGASLSIFSTKLMDAIGPKVAPVIAKLGDGISKLADLIINHTDEVIPVLAGLAAMIGGVLVAAVGSFLIAAAPIILIMLGIGAAVAGVVLLFQHWNQIVAAVMASPLGPVLKQIGSILQDIGGFLVSTFMPVWQQLQALWTGQLLPLFKQLWDAIQPLLPVLQLLGQIVGTVVVVALGILVGIITGVVKAIAGFLSGLATVIGGVVQIFTGVVQVISGIVRILYDLFTGNFGKLKGDLGSIWQGIINIFGGAWKVIEGIFQAAWGAISGFVSGLVQGIIGFFTHLWDELVGHSIIPDMINGIIKWFTSLPGNVLSLIEGLVTGLISRIGALKDMVVERIQQLVALALVIIDRWVTGWIQSAQNLGSRFMGALHSLWSNVTGFITSLPGQMLKWGEDLIKNFIQGIQNMAGGVINAVKNIGDKIKNFLHFSKPDEGPLVDVDKWMPDFGDLLVSGLNAQVGKIGTASMHIASSLALSGSPTLAHTFASSNSGPGQPIILQLDGKQFARAYLPYHVSTIRNAVGVRS